MSSNSKLDYLSKYYESGDKKKKKKKKKSRRKDESEATVLEHDEDEDVGGFAHKEDDSQPLNNDDDDDNDDDGPIVVAAQELQHGSFDNGNLKDISKDPAATRTHRRRRYDSSDASSDEKRKGQPRRRYDSSEEEEVMDKPSKGRKRHDSSDEDVNPRRRYDSSDEEVQDKRRRYDSSDEEKVSRRRRYDSSDDEDEEVDKTKAESSQRRRYDSSSEEEESSPRKAKSEPSNGTNGTASTRKRRHDSFSDNDQGDDDNDTEQRMSSGHMAGLQTGQKFQKAEAKLQRKRNRQAKAMADKYGHGDTVYREPLSSSSATAKKTAVDTVALNTGRVQKEQALQQQQEWKALQQSTFARHQDDAKLEDLRRNAVRAGDPMAAQQQSRAKSSKQQPPSSAAKPVYKGPPPKPNRFGIRPGFRWDGVDRGNGFEDKLLAQHFEKHHRKEQAYKWSTADM